MKFVVGENRRNPVKNLPRPRFVHHETNIEGPRRELGTPAVGGKHLTACATRPHTKVKYVKNGENVFFVSLCTTLPSTHNDLLIQSIPNTTRGYRRLSLAALACLLAS